MSSTDLLATAVAENLDFHKFHVLEDFFVTTYPVAAVINPSLSSSGLSRCLRTPGLLSNPNLDLAQPLLRNRPLEHDDLEYLIANAESAVIRTSLLRWQTVTSEEALRLALEPPTPSAAAYAVGHAKHLDISPIPLQLLEESERNTTFWFLVNSPMGTYMDEAPRWIAQFVWNSSGATLLGASLSYLLVKRPDLVGALRTLAPTCPQARAAVCLSGLVHDSDQQLEDLGFGFLKTTSEEVPRDEALRTWLKRGDTLLTRVVLASPFTRRATIEALQKVFSKQDTAGLFGFEPRRLRRVARRNELTCDLVDVPTRQRYALKEWLEYSSSLGGFTTSVRLVLSPLGDDFGFSSRDWKAIARVVETYGDKKCARKASAAGFLAYEEKWRERRTMTYSLEEVPFRTELVRNSLAMVAVLEQMLDDNVHEITTLLGLCGSWDGTTRDLMACVKNLL